MGKLQGGKRRRNNSVRRMIERLETRRLLAIPAGAPDPSFGTTAPGWTIADAGTANGDTPTAMAVDSQGRIIVVGVSGSSVSGNTSDIFVTRFLGSGALDPTFGINGKRVIDLAAADWARDVAVLP